MPKELTSWSGLEAGLRSAGEALLNRRLKVAVTGLSRSGKTVFITCLAHHLEHGTGLPFLNAVADRRFRGARILNELPEGVDAFPYHAHAAALRGDRPYWPDPSTDLSLLRLELRFQPRRGLTTMTGERHLMLDIVDYPGEWLIDLPLLGQSYDAWAEVTLPRLERPPYRGRMRAFLDADTERDAAALVKFYVAGLESCREDRLSLLQPGRALTPSSFSVLPEDVLFAPVPPDHPLAPTYRRRYDDYLERWVAPFKTHVVDAVDRQIVLVDVLESLNRGPAHFEDARASIAMILQGFNYGRSGYWQRLLAPKVERLIFCATKADHVAATQHANLKLLLQDMVDDAARRVRLEGIPTESLAIAALRSTDTVKTHYDNQLLSCVRGVLDDTRRERIIFPGEVPPTMPREADWDAQHFDFRRFAPRRLAESGPGRNGSGHIRLDQVLEAAVGDRLM